MIFFFFFAPLCPSQLPLRSASTVYKTERKYDSYLSFCLQSQCFCLSCQAGHITNYLHACCKTCLDSGHARLAFTPGPCAPIVQACLWQTKRHEKLALQLKKPCIQKGHDNCPFLSETWHIWKTFFWPGLLSGELCRTVTSGHITLTQSYVWGAICMLYTQALF